MFESQQPRLLTRKTSGGSRHMKLSSQINPIILKIEEDLRRLKTHEALSNSTADTISIGLSGLGNLYKCAQQPLQGLHSDEKCSNNALLDASSKLLDLGIATRDIALLLKDATRSLQYTIQEKKSESRIKSSISDYVHWRKKIKKKAKGQLSSIKGMDVGSGSKRILEDDDGEDLIIVSKMLKCVTIINVSIYEHIIIFLCTPVTKPRSRKWLFLSKLRHRRRGALDDNQNELIDVDDALCTLCCSHHMTADVEKLQLAEKKLEALMDGIEGIENGLDSMISQLTKTRASLLNIYS
ncbi:hypothetical protein Ancab_003100 [Ancistrocladus abbreviatus]